MSFFPSRGLFRAVEGGGFVAQGALLTGDVTLGKDVGIWFGCVVRGDDAPITIGERTNVQDLTMIHADTGMPNHIGKNVTIGHRCVLHGVRVGDGALIGRGSVLLGGSVIGEGALVAAGAVVRERFVVPPRTLVAGVPAKVVRELAAEEVAMFLHSAEDYVKKIRQYL